MNFEYVMQRTIAAIAAILVIVVFSSCQKELNFGNSQTVAEYSLLDNTGSCSQAIVKGEYKIGVPLTAANNILVTVMVDSIGSYSISSNTINGMSFTGKGFFSAVGEQTITLTATGKPVTDGIFMYTIGAGNCTFSVVVNKAGSSTAVFTYDGAPAACTNLSVFGTYKAGVPLTERNVVMIDVNVIRPGRYSITTELINGFLFSGNGDLPTAGYAVVKFTGIGIPVKDGAFIFTPSNGCPFVIQVNQ